MYDFDLVEALNPVDCGDCDIVLANAEKTFGARSRHRQILEAGALPVTLGGDHSITIPAVRAVSAHVEPRPDPHRHAPRHGLRRRR